MLTSDLPTPPAVPDSEHGYTLIELLVVLSVGVIVSGALFTIISVTLHQTTRTFSRVDATQQARTALARMENELHSSCVSPAVTPIKAGSTGNSVTFVSQYGAAPTLTPVQRKITFDPASGNLTDISYAATGGVAPNWTFSSTPSSTVRLLKNAAQSGTTPVFQYFAFETPTNSAGAAYVDSAGRPYRILLDGVTTVPGTNTLPANSPHPLPTPLSSADAQNAVAVLITFVAKPTGGNGSLQNTNLAANTVTDSVVLRLTAAPNHTGSGAVFSPCA
jgi:prepilin-type N-terminal cleavage/methylation domain-containing protein